MTYILLTLIYFFILFANLSSAQDITGNIEGYIMDTVGAPLSKVNISLQSESLQGIRGTATDDKGYFSIVAMPVGNYKIRISIVGYRDVTIENVQIRLGKTTYLAEIILEQKAINLPEITISGEKQIIDPTTTSYGVNLRSEDFEQLPVERNYRSIASLLPQANTSYLGDEVNFAGATGLENKYFVDGIEVTDPILGITGTDLPYNFVKEIEIITGGYEAEYRSSLGGIMNMITYSGSNALHGSAFGFFTSNSLASARRVGLLDPAQGGFSEYDFGLSIGGPIINDKLWFFAAYNPTFDRRDVNVPSFGIYTDKTVVHSFAGKLTWKASQGLNLILTSTGDLTSEDVVGSPGPPPIALENPDPYFIDAKLGGINLSLQGTYTISDGFLLDASLSRITRERTFMPSTERGNEPTFINNESGVWSGGTGHRVSNFGFETTFSVGGIFITGTHTFKGGLEYKNVGRDKDVEFYSIYRNSDTFYIEQKSGGTGEVYNRIPSIFLQDTWRIFNNLRINLGIRWDGQFLVGSNGKVSQEITDQFQPRVGFIFLPFDDGSGKIFGSFGRFTQELSTFLSASFHNDKGYVYRIIYDHDPRINPSGGDTVFNPVFSIEPEIIGLKGQYFDEFNLGYEQLIGKDFKIGVQGIYRTLREAIDDVWIESENRFTFGNPGRGFLSDFPKPQRDYTALIITLEHQLGDNFHFLASYVLSRNYGNYAGLYDSYLHGSFPNYASTFDDIEQLQKGTGLLPNDRTHVFKLSGSYSFQFGLTVGTSFTWQSGTPLSELADWGRFITQRGTVGNTPAIWDLNARFTYDLTQLGTWRARLIMDILNIASQRKPVDIVQQHYFDVDENGQPINLNPNYGLAWRYQPPMSIRFGMEVSF